MKSTMIPLIRRSPKMAGVALLGVLLGLVAPLAEAAEVVREFTPDDGETTFEAPDNVDEITVEVWGGGGKGGDTDGNRESAGGGGAGGYAQATLSGLKPEAAFDLRAGYGGTTGSPDGNESFFGASGSGGTLLSAEGGDGVPENDAAGGAGGFASASFFVSPSIATLIIGYGLSGPVGADGGNNSGGDGADGRPGLIDGGGGGAGGNDADGEPGDAPGAGGGGGHNKAGGGPENDAPRSGGDGGNGLVRIIYEGQKPEVDRYKVEHAGQGLTCVSEPVTITALDSDDDPVAPEDGTTLDLSAATDSGFDEGDWVRLIDGNGTLSTAGTGSGMGSYEFPGDESQAIIAYQYAQLQNDPEDVVLSVDDGDASGSSEDPLSVSRAGFRFVNTTDDTATIPDQISGKPSDTGYNAHDLGVQAIRASDDDPTVCEGQFNDGETATIDMAAECRNPADCAGEEMEIDDTSIATSDDNEDSDSADAYDEVELTFNEDSIAPLVLDYPDAGRTRLYARYEIPLAEDPDDPEAGEASGGVMRGKSNAFVWRPFAFSITSSRSDFTATGPGDDSPDGPFVAAGSDFDVTVEAVVWQSADDGDDDGVPDSGANLQDNAATPNFGNSTPGPTVDITHTLSAPSGAGAVGGTLSGGSDVGGFGTDGGGATTTQLSFDEVGILTLTADLTDYLGEPGADVTGSRGGIGRFIPADFTQSVPDAGELEHTCDGTFTYIGEPFAYSMFPELEITARNSGGATTQNYRGDFAKLTAGDVERSAPSVDDTQAGTDGDPLPVESTLAQGDLTANGDGTLTYTFVADDEYRYRRNIDRNGDGDNDARVGPFDANFTVTVDAIEDSDGVTATTLNDVEPASTELRFGRMVANNALGSERSELAVPLRIEYWNGSTWLVNGDDRCTTLSLGDEVTLTSDDGNTDDGTGEVTLASSATTGITETSPVNFSTGTASLTLSAPNDVGWVDIDLLLDGTGLNRNGWLREDTDDDGIFDQNPRARASFGLFPGSANQIYRKEVLR